jgi:hypothetical protein
MRQLKCIGGKLSGRYLDVPQFAESVRVPLPPQRMIGNPIPDDTETIEEVEFRVITYYVHAVHGSAHDPIEFLAPEGWTAEKALRRALT